MSKMRHKDHWPSIGLSHLLLWAIGFATLIHAQQLKQGAQSPRSSSKPELSSCTLKWQEELITCRGINYTQLVNALTRIRQQIDDKKQVAEGRNLGSGIEDEEVIADKSASNGTLIGEKKNLQRSSTEVRELNIFKCDVPKLTSSSLESSSSLEILSVVSSGVKEVRSDALNEHAHSLMRLTLTHNLLDALPQALHNLTKLEVLDLSHNEIDHLPEGTLLFNLHRLRQLHLDHNKLGQILGAQARLSLRSPGLSLTVFNLEPLRESLTHLTLAHNDLEAFPEQFSRPFTRLTNLDLSSNEISEVLADAFQEMPRLQCLDLSANLLKEFNPIKLSTSVLELNLRGNPWNCTCDSKWILESLWLNNSQPTVVTPPTCSSPLHLRHRELVSLEEKDICPSEEHSRTNKVIYIGDDVDGSLNQALQSLHLLNVTVLNHEALIISWRVDGNFYRSQEESSEPLSWAITLHKTRDDPRQAKVTQMKLERYKEESPDWRPSESRYNELLHGLEKETQYTLCLVPLQDDYLFTRPDQCRYVTMPKVSRTTTTTTSTTTSTTTTTTTEAPKVGLLLSTENYEVKTEKVLMLGEARKVLMSWNVTVLPRNRFKREAIMLQPLGWKITYRKFAEENETEIVLVSRGGEPIQNFTNHYTVEDLNPGTGYIFCFRSLSDTEVHASLQDNNGRANDMTGNLDSHSYDPEVVLAITGNQQQSESHTDQLNTNSIEEGQSTGHNNVPQQTTTEDTLYPDYELEPHLIPSNIPPVLNFPSPSSSFERRPPRPPPQNSGGNFVYTSTGQRIALPSSPSGPSSPFNLPSIVGPSLNINPSQSQWSSTHHPILDIPTKPEQRFTYDFEDSPAQGSSKQTYTYDFSTEPSTSTTTKEPQRFTYVTRRKRSVNEDSKVTFEKYLDLGFNEFCKEVVTSGENSILAPVAIASTVSTSTTVIIAIVFCCCCPKRCCRKKSASGWNGKAVASSRKISTISSPTPVNVYTRQNSTISGTTLVEESNNDLKSIPSQASTNGPEFIDGGPNGQQIKTGRSVSVTSSTGYLTPLPAGNSTVPDAGRVFKEAKLYLPSQKAYLNSVKDRLLQQHKDLKDFHPGYDIPPTSSIKSLLGYDYPHPTPVNPIGTHTDSAAKPALPSKATLPSPSSSDSNYNASVNDPQEVESLRPEVNLNIPFTQNKSSDSSKKFNLTEDPDLNKSIEYNYISPEDVNSRPRTYIKNGPTKTKHRKFGSPQRLPDERNATSLEHAQDLVKQLYGNGSLQSPTQLSRSVPDLTVGTSQENSDQVTSQPSEMTPAARLSLLIGSQRKEEENGANSLPTILMDGTHSKSSVPSASAENLYEVSDYANLSSSQKNSTEPKLSKDRDHYHTWSSSRPGTPRSRPSLGEVVLTGGTLIEVPEGYVIPKPPKPARSVRLLVPGEDKPITLDKSEIRINETSMEYPPPPTSPKEAKTASPLAHVEIPSRSQGKSQITHLMTPELDQNRVVISTGMAV